MEWREVDEFLADRLLPVDGELDGAHQLAEQEGLPPIAVSALQGQFLQLCARMAGAASILEIGALGGYSGIWLGRALPEGGRMISLEIDPRHAAVAQRNLEAAGLGDRVEVRVGRALDTLPQLAEAGMVFDFVFIDADKPGNTAYFQWARRLTRPGSVIVIDNVVRQGQVADLGDHSPAVLGSREVVDAVGADPGVVATVLQTVGAKGHDGFVVALVTAAYDG